jgi:hypothetical protein
MTRRGMYAVTVAVTVAAAIAAAGVEAVTAHAGPAKPATLTWHSYRVPGAGPFAAVQCPSTEICVAITKHDQLWTTRNASAKHPAWKQTAGLKVMGPEEDFEQQSGFNLSCPSTHLCVTSYFGDILTSTNPTGEKSAWKSTNIQPAGAKADGKIDSLSCSSATLCVAGMNEWVNEEGGGTYLNLATTTNPTGGTSAWKVVKGPGDYLTSLSCGSGGVCAGGDEFGTILATATASAGATSWKEVGDVPSTLDWQTCVSAKLCLGVDDSGRPVASTRPAVAKTWVAQKLAKGHYMRIASCAGTGFCVAAGGDKQGQAMLTSTTPTRGSSWKPAPLHIGQTIVAGLQCRSRSFCVAVGQGGLVVVGRR